MPGKSRRAHGLLATGALVAALFVGAILKCNIPDTPATCTGACQTAYTSCACRCEWDGAGGPCYQTCSEQLDSCIKQCAGS